MPVALKDPYNEKRLFAARALVAGLFMLCLLLLLVGRYFSLQILEYETYQTQSDRNRVQLQPVPPKRGLIFDRNGVLLAENVPSYSLTIVKELVDDYDQTIALLRELLPISDDDLKKFERRLQRRRPYQAVPLKLKLSQEQIATLAVNRYRLPGIDVSAQLARHYPMGEEFAHVLGYVGRINEREQFELDPVNYSGTDSIGKLGIEKYYESQLHGLVGHQNVETNARGRVLRVLEREDPVPGVDLTLHLDAHVQKVAHQALGQERGSVVAIDTRTGGVVAMVSTPSFDANLFVGGISSKDYAKLRDSLDLPLFNRALQGQYPPASTLKPMFGLAGLHHGVVTPGFTVRDPGWYQLPNDERYYRDWKKGGHGHAINLHQAIVESCDTYFYDMAYRMGIDRMSSFAAPFGLGKATGVDNTHERSGLLPSRSWKRQMKRLPWFPGETLNVSIGQGYMLTTPMQLASMTATLANRGQRFVPRLLKRAGDQEVSAPRLSPIAEVSDRNWDVVIAAMRDVVHGRKGTAKGIRRGAPYRMAGKTGTAQVIGIAQDAEYDAEQLAKRQRDHALFIGFAPLDDPHIAVAVIVENGEHGSTAAAPIARKVFDAYLLERPATTATHRHGSARELVAVQALQRVEEI
jgi:penicillin-binding protein 2